LANLQLIYFVKAIFTLAKHFLGDFFGGAKFPSAIFCFGKILFGDFLLWVTLLGNFLLWQNLVWRIFCFGKISSYHSGVLRWQKLGVSMSAVQPSVTANVFRYREEILSKDKN